MSEAKKRDTSEATEVDHKTRLLGLVAQVKGIADALIGAAHTARNRAEYTSEVTLNGYARQLRGLCADAARGTNSPQADGGSTYTVANPLDASTQSAPELRTTAATPAWRCDHSIREVSPDGKRCLACERDLCASDATAAEDLEELIAEVFGLQEGADPEHRRTIDAIKEVRRLIASARTDYDQAQDERELILCLRNLDAEMTRREALEMLLRRAVPLAAYAQDVPKRAEEAVQWHHDVAVALDPGQKRGDGT